MKNKWVSFLSRVAFICNLCFLLGVVIRFTQDFIPNQTLTGTVVILGTVVSFILNIILQACLLVLRLNKKDIPVKAWLRIFNLALFIVQVVYYFLLPGN